MDRPTLLRLRDFLHQAAETNEATEFDNAQEYLVGELTELVKERGNTSIAEDFETPFIHPMITVQKWIEELKLIVSQALQDDIDSGFEK